MLSAMAAWDAYICVCHQLLLATETWHIDSYPSSFAIYVFFVFLSSNFMLVSRHLIRICKTHQRRVPPFCIATSRCKECRCYMHTDPTLHCFFTSWFSDA